MAAVSWLKAKKEKADPWGESLPKREDPSATPPNDEEHDDDAAPQPPIVSETVQVLPTPTPFVSGEDSQYVWGKQQD